MRHMHFKTRFLLDILFKYLGEPVLVPPLQPLTLIYVIYRSIEVTATSTYVRQV